jgi:hypothetical protein
MRVVGRFPGGPPFLPFAPVLTSATDLASLA